jgi:hypothetical protein
MRPGFTAQDGVLPVVEWIGHRLVAVDALRGGQ